MKTARRRSRPSGRFLLRIEPGLHALLREAAKAAGMSLNDYCRAKLAMPVGSMAALAGAQPVLERVAALLGDQLLGLVAFGSWSRGEAGPSSDVDVLIVIETNRPLTRKLYRDWDSEPLSWNGHSIEPHFVHLSEGGEVGTVWAEAAVDGIVLFERELSVSRRLAAIRRQIAAGRLVRRVIHGQPYWAEVA